jgi:phenylpyruvate tautomerase PptA (4-oxalocrotonate tautomerase family)
MSDILEFGFDEAKMVDTGEVDKFRQTAHGEVSRISIVSFKKFSEIVFSSKAKEKGSPLTDQEKADLIQRTDAKIAEKLGKEVSELTEADRLDIRQPKFAMSRVHFKDGLGTIRCLSEWKDKEVVKKKVCCEKLGAPEQAVSVVVMSYYLDEEKQPDLDFLLKKKGVKFQIWKLSPKKFRGQVEPEYKEARNRGWPVVDLKVTLDGDQKYQKQAISATATALWAADDFDPDVRKWILDNGIRMSKSLDSVLGFAMKEEKILEKLGMGGGQGSPQLNARNSEETAKVSASYDDMLV